MTTSIVIIKIISIKVESDTGQINVLNSYFYVLVFIYQYDRYVSKLNTS